ncbi:MAG: class I SAM-dependent methyltransferase [Phycisphaerae bacterium]|nr:class I SAM-dependent methyltransferase [Phycisphaerae bacterium]
MNTKLHSSSDPREALLADFHRLWAEADDLWERLRDTAPFHSYVSADYAALYDSLRSLQGQAMTFLEWGSGLGIATIMASRMGFEAYGIEAEAQLHEYSEEFARTYGPKARFVQGSFIPDDFEWNPADGDDVYRTILDTPAAYDELDMELRDFDLVFAFPWPDEHTLYRNIMRQLGAPDALLLTYDSRDGFKLLRGGEE